MLNNGLNHIATIFVVTVFSGPKGTGQSLYKVSTELVPNTNWPTVTKIRQHGTVNRPTGWRLEYGSHVGITENNGLLLYRPRLDNDRIARPNRNDSSRVHTSGIAAMFTEQEQELAEHCVDSEWLTVWDPDWQTQTDVALMEVGDKHPVFILDESVSQRLEFILAD